MISAFVKMLFLSFILLLIEPASVSATYPSIAPSACTAMGLFACGTGCYNPAAKQECCSDGISTSKLAIDCVEDSIADHMKLLALLPHRPFPSSRRLSPVRLLPPPSLSRVSIHPPSHLMSSLPCPPAIRPHPLLPPRAALTFRLAVLQAPCTLLYPVL
jgi:hypothetical protein